MKRIKLFYPLMALALALSACNQPQPTPKPTEPAPKPSASPAPSATNTSQPPAQPTPAPRPTTNPIVVDVTPARGEALPLDKPLVVQFDQPMDKTSVEQALRVRGATSDVNGKIAWQSDSILTFTPQGGWKRDEVYNAQVGDGAKSAKGLPLNKPQSFRFSSIGVFEVAQMIPANGAGDVTPDATITVLFNRPVVPLVGVAQQASLPNPLTLSPDAPGKGEWINTSTYVFKPATSLSAGATYKAKINAELKDTLGTTLGVAHEWSFSVAAPIVKFVTPGANARDVDLRQPISVTFSQKMDHASAEAAFKLSPAVRGTFHWANEAESKRGQIEGPPLKSAPSTGGSASPAQAAQLGEVMAFVPDENYQRATNYALELGAGAKAAAGDGRTKDAHKSAFRTIENLAIASTQPAAGSSQFDAESRQFLIRFTAPVLPETVMPNVSFDPPLTQTNLYTYWDAPGKQFVINGLPFQPSTRYTVNIAGNVSDKYGQALGKPSVVSFVTGAARPVVILGSGAEVGTLNASQPALAQVGFRNITKLDFQLSRLSVDDFYGLTGQNAYQARQTFTPGPNQLMRTWSVNVSAKQNELASAVVPLTENRAALPTGVYFLTMDAPELKNVKNTYFQPVRQILVVSNYQVTMKQALNETLVWATDLTTGAPAPNLPVALVDKNRKTLANVATGADGVAVANVSYALAYEAFYAIIGQPGANSFGIGFSQWTNDIEPYMFGLNADYINNPGQTQYKTYLYTDRPIYRPGQTVNFKGIIRTDTDARYNIASGLTGVTVQVSSDRGAKVYSQTVAVNGNGTFNGSFALADGAATGYYGVGVLFPAGCAPMDKPPKPDDTICQGANLSFQVAAYRKPEFEVSMAPAKVDLTSGEMAQVNVQANAYFGGNIGGAKVDWTMTATPYYFDRYADRTDPFLGRYSFIDADSVYPVWPPVRKDTGVFANGVGQTDANGKFVIPAPVDLSKSETSLSLDFSANVTDLNDQTVSANTNAIAHKGPFYFGIAPEDYVLSAGKMLTAHVVAVDWNGKPMTGQTGAVALYRREWKLTYGVNEFGENGPRWVPQDIKLTENPITTDANGRAASSFVLAEGGEYRVVVTSGAVKAANVIWVTNSGAFLSWRRDDSNRISLRPDKTEYKVGETARVLVPSPFTGTVNALMTIERGDIIQQKVVQLKSNNETLEIPITQDFAPNAFVSLVLAKGAGSGQNGLAEFRLGYAELTVDPSAFKINLEITPDKPGYGPRETATYDIRATTTSGQPVQAEISIALIDKAVLALAEPNSQPPMQVFYGARGLLVRTSNSLSVRADVADMAKAASAPGGMGGGGGGAADQNVRQNFQDVAFWSAITQTGPDGRAQVKVTLPDNLTTWVLDARAVSADTKVGSATKDVLTSKPLLVRPVTPRFFVVGDEATLGAVVNNNTTSAVQAQVTLAASGLALKGAAMQMVSVPANGSARVDWPVSVPDGNMADVTISAVAGDLKDSAKPELGAKGIPVLRYLSPETVGTAGEVSEPGKKLEIIALPPRLEVGKSELEVNVNTSLAQVITESAYFLRENAAYEDNLQIAARLLVNVSQNAPREEIVADAAKLLDNQRDGAGWGWFKDSETTSPIISAYALWALNRAWGVGGQDLGSRDPINRAAQYLQNQLGDADTFLNRVAADESAFYAFVLSEANVPVNGYLDQLHKNKGKLGSFGKALLAMALQNVNKTDARISGLLADVNSTVTQSATGATWSSANGGLQPWAFTAFFCTDTRATAIILYALARLDAKNPMLPNVVRWLVSARTGRSWEGTQDSVWAILALDAYANATGDRNANYDWRVSLNDAQLMAGKASPSDITPNRAVITATRLLSGTNALAFERGDGAGRLYYTAQLKAYLPAAEAKALDRGISISRVYELADCEPQPDKLCEALASAPVGKNVRVRLTVVAPTALYFVKVADPFAAGMEPVELSSRRNPIPMMKFWPWFFTHTQLYDDHAEIYADYLPAGTHEFSYVMHTSLVGSFNVMPAYVTQSYFPETFGRSDGQMFVVSR